MRKILAVVIVVLALAGAACGGSDPDPAKVLASAAEKTIDAKTSRVAMQMQLPSPSGGSASLKAEGAFDYGKRVGTMSMDMSDLGLPVNGNVEMVLLGDTFYMKLPAGLLPGKPWLKIDMQTLSQTAGVDLGGLQQLGSNDPSAHLRYFVGAGDDTKKVGEEKVRGVDTTHYKGTFDLNKAKADAPTALKDDIQRVIDQLGGPTFPGEVWVDGDGLLRRMKMTLTPKAAAGSGPVTINEELYDFGVKVDATPPPADQVSDFAQLLQSAGQK